MVLYGSPFFQLTLIFFSLKNRCHHFFSRHSFLNHFSPVVCNPVARPMDSSVTSNSNEPTIAQPPLNEFTNTGTMAMSKPSNFCKYGRNPNSCNSVRFLWYSAFCSIFFKDDGSFLTGAMFEFSTILYHNLKRILVSDTNGC